MDFNSDKTLHRTFTIELDERAVETKGRTVELAFSSEIEYMRDYGLEVLSHDRGAVDMSRMVNAPLLLDHDMREQIGVVLNARIDDDKVGRATVKFSRSVLGNEIFQDVKDGIRTQVSVGYVVKEMELTGERDGIMIYTAVEWKPFEISIVPVAADPTVGVGRSEEILEDNMSEKEIIAEEKVEEVMTEAVVAEEVVTEEVAVEAVAVEEVVAEEVVADDVVVAEEVVAEKSVDMDALKAEVRAEIDAETTEAIAKEEAVAKLEAERVECIRALGVEHKQSDLMQKSIENGDSVEEATQKVLSTYTIPTGDNTMEDTRNNTGLDSHDVKDFSVLKAARYLSNPNKTTANEAGLEIEVSNTIADATGKEARGIFIPENSAVRANTVGTATAGGNLVETELLAESFIDLLRNQSALMGSTTVLNGLVGKVDIPRQTGTATCGWVAENGSQAESSATFDHVSMDAKTLAARTQMSRRTLFQTTPDIEGIVRRDLTKSMALTLDQAIVFGSGSSNQPTGVANTTSVNALTNGTRTNGKSITWEDVTFFVEQVANDNALMGDLKFVMNSKTEGALMRIQQFSSSNGMSAYDGLKSLYGHITSNQLRSNLTKGTGTGLSEMIFGNLKDILVGQWTGMDMIVDPYSNTNGSVEIRVFHDIDVAVRHPESLCYAADIITT